ncbi:hypothetical protein RJI07_06200 [Mycoplasmatota bacterium WC30]
MKEGFTINKKKKALKLSQIYAYDKIENCYLVQISLDSYDEIFNTWDAAPVKRRDLATDLLDFLEQVAYDIPMSENVKFVFQLPKELKNEKKETLAKEGIYHNFRMINHFISKELSKNNRKIVTYLFLGIAFLSISYLFQTGLDLKFPFSILVDGFFIGGWVMFWEAFSLFFFSGIEHVNRRSRFTRYSNSKIEFKYE